MRLRLFIDGVDYSDATLVDSLSVTADSTEAISTAQFDVFELGAGALYDVALYDVAVFGFEILEYSTVELKDADAGDSIVFSGLVVEVDKREDNQFMVWGLRCVDWGSVLDRTIINQSWPSGTTDAQIVIDVCSRIDASWGITADAMGVGIFVIANDLGLFEAKDQTARDVLENVCQLTGGEWHVTYLRKVRYYKPGSIVAPFGLSDTPNETTTVGFSVEQYSRDFTRATNRLTLLGAVLSNGTEMKITVVDPASQAEFGILSRTLIDRQITDGVQLSLRATTELYDASMPRVQLTAGIYQPGVARGMTMAVQTTKFNVSANMIVRTVEMNVIAPDRQLKAMDGRAHHVARWRVTLGTRKPDLIYILRRLQRKTNGPTTVPTAVIPPGSITPDDLMDGFEGILVRDVLPALPDLAISDTAVVFLTTDRKLYRRTGDTWTAYVDASEIEGQITTPQLAPGSVISAVLADGAVVSAKIPSGAILSDKIAAGAVEANAIAANAIGAEKIQANAITAGKLAANAVVAGNVAALAIQAGNIASDAVTAGTIAAGAVKAVAIAAGAVTSDKLDANEIQLGYGSGRPAVFTAWNTSNQVVATIGDLSKVPGSSLPANTYFGIWAKMGGFGGSNYGDAPIYTDVNGNLFIRNTTFTITAADGSTIKTSPTTFDQATYANALSLEFTKPGDSITRVISRGVVLYDSAGRKCGAFVRSPSGNGSELTLYPASGSTFNILLDGMTGKGRFDGGLQVGAVNVVNASGQVIGPISAASITASGSITGGSFAVPGSFSVNGSGFVYTNSVMQADGGFRCQSYTGMNTAIQVRIGDGSTRTLTYVGGLLINIASP